MDTITTIIVTVLVNAGVTGIIVYLIQKRIERSYNRQMEEFRAVLQRSLIEHQIKFSKIYPKTLEVLETYTQKVYEASRFVSNYILATGTVFLFEGKPLLEADLGRVNAEMEKITLDQTKLEEKEEELSKLQISFSETREDAARYLGANRLYLSDTILTALDDIREREFRVGWSLDICMKYPNKPIRNLCTYFPLSVEQVTELLREYSEETNSALFIGKLRGEYDHLVERLEKLYKSAADTGAREKN